MSALKLLGKIISGFLVLCTLVFTIYWMGYGIGYAAENLFQKNFPNSGTLGYCYPRDEYRFGHLVHEAGCDYAATGGVIFVFTAITIAVLVLFYMIGDTIFNSKQTEEEKSE